MLRATRGRGDVPAFHHGAHHSRPKVLITPVSPWSRPPSRPPLDDGTGFGAAGWSPLDDEPAASLPAAELPDPELRVLPVVADGLLGSCEGDSDPMAWRCAGLKPGIALRPELSICWALGATAEDDPWP